MERIDSFPSSESVGGGNTEEESSPHHRDLFSERVLENVVSVGHGYLDVFGKSPSSDELFKREEESGSGQRWKLRRRREREREGEREARREEKDLSLP